MSRTMRKLGVAALSAVMLSGAGCAQMGSLEDVLGGVMNPGGGAGTANANEIHGEIRSVDTRSQTIRIYTTDGRTGDVAYDRNTRVIYQQREYEVSALEAGDRVAVRIRQDAQGNAYTDQIHVTQSVQEVSGGTQGGGASPQYSTQTVQGNVGRVDYDRGMFQVQVQNSASTWVTLPYNPRDSEVDRFRRLRSGDYVRVQGRFLSRDRFEMERFVS